MEKQSLLEILFFAQRDIYKTYKDSEESNVSLQKANALYYKLKEALKDNKDLVNLLIEYVDAQAEHIGDTEINAYCNGFKAGLKIAMESAID